ncbi:MAG: hypothetical protein HY011_07755 [Acidobacteria bacterium]|nr:hypothetical protein [Acidobacteriota bacterium]
MNSIFDQMRDAARRKAAELDEKYDLKTKLEQGVNTAGDLARKAGETVNEAAQVARAKATKVDEELRVTENVKTAANKAGETIREGAQTAEQTARDEKTRLWLKDNPGKATFVTLSLVAGIRAGSALPGLGATVLGSTIAGNWFFHSALPIVGMRKLIESYTGYLKEQEQRLANGQMDEAERARLEFQRNMTKYVGAPLLGAFSVAAGATMIGSALSGATVTGFPLNLIIGGNPLLNGIWFFANGVICISEGYKFFMIALADEAEVQRVVREIKGLLPAAATA